jgi:hypothetical protein
LVNLLLILDARDLEGVWKSENTMSLGELWLELFRFYAFDFNISGRVVCIEQSSPLLQSSNTKRWTGKKFAVKGMCLFVSMQESFFFAFIENGLGPTHFHHQ